MTLEERKLALEQRLTELVGRRTQTAQALAELGQSIERLVGALQTVEELLNESTNGPTP